jgi:hypothetical protein
MMELPSQEALYFQQLLRASFDHGDWQCIVTIQKAFSWTWLFLGAAVSAENKTRERFHQHAMWVVRLVSHKYRHTER